MFWPKFMWGFISSTQLKAHEHIWLWRFCKITGRKGLTPFPASLFVDVSFIFREASHPDLSPPLIRVYKTCPGRHAWHYCSVVFLDCGVGDSHHSESWLLWIAFWYLFCFFVCWFAFSVPLGGGTDRNHIPAASCKLCFTLTVHQNASVK